MRGVVGLGVLVLFVSSFTTETPCVHDVTRADADAVTFLRRVDESVEPT